MLRGSHRASVAAIVLILVALPAMLAQPPAAASRRQTALVEEIRVLLLHHPKLRRPAVRRHFADLATAELALAAQPMTAWRFWYLGSHLARQLDDPHTFVDPPILTPFSALEVRIEREAIPELRIWRYPAKRTDYLPLSFFWASDGLVAVPIPRTPSDVRLGDQVVQIGNLRIPSLERRLGDLISGNRYWVRWNGAQDLSLGYFLHWLGVVSPQGDVYLVLRHADGSLYHLSLPLREELATRFAAGYNRARAEFLDRFRAPPGLTFSVRPFVWAVSPRGNYGVFWLRLCWNSPAYREAMTAFFTAVDRGHVRNVVLDLQENPGGNSEVVMPFVEHIPAAYAEPPLYDGKVFVLTSPSTFSSALMVADILYVHGVATTVGQPTGLAPSAYGEILPFEAQGGLLVGQYSTLYFHATGPQAGAAALTPQMAVPLTVHDIQAGINPISRWLATLQTSSYEGTR